MASNIGMSGFRDRARTASSIPVGYPLAAFTGKKI
jgi:hypothetical protein